MGGSWLTHDGTEYVHNSVQRINTLQDALLFFFGFGKERHRGATPRGNDVQADRGLHVEGEDEVWHQLSAREG